MSFNAIQLGKELGVTHQTARNRLNSVKTIKDLYRPLNETIRKEHHVEGEVFTSDKLAKMLNCSESTARARLYRHKTIKELTKPIQTNSEKDGKISHLNETPEQKKMRKLMLGAW